MISSRSRLLVVATGVTLLVAASGCGADLAAVGSPSADRAASIDAGSGRDREVATSPDVKGSADAAANEDGSGSVRAASRSRETTSTVAKAISPASGVPRSGRAPAPPTPPPTLYTSNDGRPDESGTGSAPIGAGAPASKKASSQVQAAIDAGDICGVYAAMSDLQISAGTAAEFRSGMTTVLDVITRSAPLVPAELQDDWGVLTDGTSRVVALLDKPGASVYSAAEIYREPGYVGAMERTDAWMEASCAR